MSGVASQIAKDRAKAKGLGSSKNPVKFADQDFQKLKAECLASKTLFEDPKFPAAQSSLGSNLLGPDSEKVIGLEWKRPKDIKKNPEFIVGGRGRDDICQGKLGDCWLLGSIACLTLNNDCVSRVIPQDQYFKKDYAGIFRFLFWQYGQWVEVVVDDRLPTKNNQPIFVKSKTSNEFWSSLLEKAYAKINGSYETIIAGYALDSLEDFTGGVGEVYNTKSTPDDLFEKMQKALMEKSFVSCSSVAEEAHDEKTLSESIVRGHLYSVTGAEKVTCVDNEVKIIRVRNPWGRKEWDGAWSDNSEEWNNVDPKIKADLNITNDEGEFWIAYSDFLKEFSRVEICDIYMSEVCCGGTYKWCLTEFSGSWKKGSTAGGKKTLGSFWINPQYPITLKAPDGDSDEKCPIVVSLIQKDRRKIKLKCGAYLNLGFYIYKVNSSDEIPLGKKFFKKNECVASFTKFRSYREASKRFELPPGDYVIVPTTDKASLEADFYLRIFTEKPTGAHDPECIMPTDIFQLDITPETDSEFDIVKDELQQGEFKMNEVKNMLNKMLAKYPELKSEGLNIKAVRNLIKLMDVDNTKTLSIDEFKKTWLKVDNYWRIFQSADEDNSRSLCDVEFRNAIIKAGFKPNSKILIAIVDRLTHDNFSLDFSMFISILANLETSINMYNLLNPNRGGSISLSLDEWLLTKLA
ncbi:calpain-8-like isoform 2-T2 [Anomaloglossus baeobatrachus]|uniref:calpain-8-like isoform X2 n=1 Tax=Anomaloglossus baeobatrachus TaxID=238106 RepID=UPI003F4FB6BC